MKTHRCEGSLGAKVSIRYGYLYNDKKFKEFGEKWRLSNYTNDNDLGCILTNYVAVIKYCPFCSKELY
jgi:hypothetical protein